MAANRIFMGIILLGVAGGAGVFSSGGVSPYMSVGHNSRGLSSLRSVEMTAKRNDVVRIARAEVGIREATGNNDGPRVEEYLAYTGFKKGNPYCASYVSWCFHKAGYTQPKTAWSPSMFPASRLTKDPKPADLFGIYFANLNRIAHVGLVAEIKDDWIYSIEANSNNNGSRNGDGVYERLRHKRKIKAYADWIISNN